MMFNIINKITNIMAIRKSKFEEKDLGKRMENQLDNKISYGNPFADAGEDAYVTAVINVIDLRQFVSYFNQSRDAGDDDIFRTFQHHKQYFEQKTFLSKRFVYRTLEGAKADLHSEFADLFDLPTFKGVEIILTDSENNILFSQKMINSINWLNYVENGL